MSRWLRYFIGRLVPARVLTVDDLRTGARLRWGWRATEIRSDAGVIAHIPPPSKPGHIGPFPLDEEPREEE